MATMTEVCEVTVFHVQVLPTKSIHPRLFNPARPWQVLGVAALTIMGGLAVGAIASLIAKDWLAQSFSQVVTATAQQLQSLSDHALSPVPS